MTERERYNLYSAIEQSAEDLSNEIARLEEELCSARSEIERLNATIDEHGTDGTEEA